VAPALLRHLAAYVELSLLDLERFQREVARSLLTFVAVGVSAFFAILMGCVAVIAATWDTPHRVSAILGLCAGFVLIGLIAVLYRSNALRDREPILAAVREQWHEDRVLLERVLAEQKEPS
jgi:uncharacterized membrane protein YqjE